MFTVAWIHVAPVKSLAIVSRQEVALEPSGVADNRRFHMIGEDGRLLNGKVVGPLVRVVPAWDDATAVLRLELPGDRVVEGRIDLGDRVETRLDGRQVAGRVVIGPWSPALSELAGRPVRLVYTEQAGTAVDRGGPASAISLLSSASLTELARQAGEERVDPRRFRMLVGIDGCRPNEEDEWLGRDVEVGDAVVHPTGHVGRCAVTTQDPDTGISTLDTLRALAGYRPRGTERLPFGVHGMVVRPGRVWLGAPVRPA